MLVIRRLIERFVREEDGITLVISIATMSILAITTAGVIVAGTANEGTAYTSLKQRTAFAVAQQALAYGDGMVYGDVEASPSVTPPTATQNLPSQPSLNGLTVSGTYTASTTDNQTWHVVATGTVGTVTRTVSNNVTPSQTVTASGSTSIWDYGVYENDPVGSLSTCAISGGTVVALPVYSKGDFCMSGSLSKIANNIEIGGKLLTTGGAQIGTSTSPIAKLRVVNGCNVNSGSYVTAGTNPCDGSHNSTYASSVSTTLDTVPAFPTVDFSGAYTTQKNLTKSASCTSSGGACCPANLFDNNSTMDNSDTSIAAAMFPTYSYQCTVGTNTINWTPAGSGASTLAVNGTLYFDGSISTNKVVQYTGRGSMYFTGGVTFSGGSSQFCGSTSCASTWGSNPSTDPLIVWVTDCMGISLTSSCVNLSGGGKYQVYVYTTGVYTVSGGSSNAGHVLCWSASLSGGTNISASFTSLPPGIPTSTGTTTITGTPPTGWSG